MWNRMAMVCLASAMLFGGCAQKAQEAAKSSTPAKEYQMRGEITGLDSGGHVATIKHEEIKDSKGGTFMGAMTMGYHVKDAAEFSKLTAGEPVTATVYVTDDDMWIGNIQKAAK